MYVWDQTNEGDDGKEGNYFLPADGHSLRAGLSFEALKAQAYGQLQKLKIEPPTTKG